MEKHINTGLHMLTMSIKYLCLVENVLYENIKSGNRWTLCGENEIADREYEEKTKWSDFNISIPILFNFYHGLELSLKGLLLLKKEYKLSPDHKIESLYEEFKNNYNKQEDLTRFFDKYLLIKKMPLFISNVLQENNLGVSGLYEFFRYPFDKKFKNTRNYQKIKYTEDEGLDFFTELMDDISDFRKNMVLFYRTIENKIGQE